MQTRLILKERRKFIYPEDQTNYIKEGIQRIEIHRGCPHACPYCFEPQISIQFPIPEIKSNKVEINDMNFLSQLNILERIRELGSKTFNNKLVYYELVCGIDFRLLNQDIADELIKNRFGIFDKQQKWQKGIRFAWDWLLEDQYKITDCLKILKKAGYKNGLCEVFILSNWKIPKSECEMKLDLLKILHLKVCNCVWLKDLGNSRIIPEFWNMKEIELFRNKCSIHNQAINFKIFPDLKRVRRYLEKKRGLKITLH